MSLGPLMIDVRATELTHAERDLLRHPLVGGVILFKRNFSSAEQVLELVADIHSIREPALLVAVDQEGGRVQRFQAPLTTLPPMRTLGHCYDSQGSRSLSYARASGWLMAAEVGALGLDFSFAPVIDVDRGLCDVIGDRALHSDPAVVATLAKAYMQGMGDAGMAAVAKHYPSHSGVVADTHLQVAEDRRPFSELLDDLEPYRRLIDAGLVGVMAAHVAFPSVDPQPAGFSAWWLETQLRGELGFNGAVFSDDLSMAGAANVGDMVTRVERALQAGCDMALICNAPDQVVTVLERLQLSPNPRSQLRLMRLRRRRDWDWSALQTSAEWIKAERLVAELDRPPTLSLEG